MIYKFKSQFEGDVLMLEANGDQILNIIGRQPASQGIITAEQIPAAVMALETAINAIASVEPPALPHIGTETDPNGDSVPLRHRAAPFIDLLRKSAHAGKDVVWGV